MKKIFTLAFLSVCFNFYGQIGFERNVVIDRLYGDMGQIGVIAEDFDNDGKVDIAQMSHGAIMWFKNIDGQGEFSHGKLMAAEYTALNAQQFAVADVNGDGYKDLIFVSGTSTAKLYVVKNNGDGTFGFYNELYVYAPQVYAIRFQVVDMDGDGDLDIAYERSGLRWQKNDGQGNFTAVSGTISPSTYNFYFTDISGDGIADMVTNIANTIKYFKNSGEGTFILQQTVDTNGTGGMITGADMDGNGSKDLLFVYSNPSTYAQTIRLYKNNNGIFAASQNLISLPDNSGNVVVLPADVNSDGKIDLTVSSQMKNKVSLYKSLGDAVLAAEQVVSQNLPSVSGIATGDINGDGKADILAAAPGENKLVWIKNMNTEFAPEVTVGRCAGLTTFLDAGDIDGDGDKDLVSATENLNQVAWYKNGDGQGDFSVEQQIVISPNIAAPKFVKLANFDGDNDLDIFVVVTEYSNGVEGKTGVLFKNNGVGIFSKTTVTAYLEGAQKYYYSDIDGDGDMDVIALKSPTMYIYKNNGNGTFTTGLQQMPWAQNLTVEQLIFGDLDNDGDNDVIVGSYSGNKYEWFANDGQGHFSTSNLITQGEIFSSHKLTLTDIDNDGDNDIICWRQDINKISWFKNTNGQGAFSPVIEINTPGVDHINLIVYDFDGDGFKDFVGSSDNGINTRWYKNDGQQNFSPAYEINNTLGYSSILGLSDFNADGKVDLYTFNYSANGSVNWLKNLGAFNNTITGTVRLDVDANGCSASDVPVPQVLVTTQNSGNTWATFTNASGGFTAYGNQGTFTTSITSTLPGFNANPQSHQSVFANNSGSTSTADFCLQAPSAVTDLEVNIYRFADVRPGFPVQYKVVVINTGTVQVQGTVTLNFDGAKLNFNNVVPAATAQTANTFTFDLGTMLPFAVKEFNFSFTAKTIPTINLGDSVIFTANTAIAGDATPGNNSATNTAIVVGSYDPNDIAVREGSQILLEDADEYLHYLIRFQNTGNFYAERVVVKNPIDSKLDWTTMQLESMSHNGRVEIINGAEATFTFDAIYLPASTVNEPASHGYIAYKIKPKANVQLGDTFTEQAYIYFDFNPAIDTNIVTTTVVDNAAGLPQFTAETVSVYPVPSKAILNVKANSDITKIEIYNQAGQRVLGNVSQNNIDISPLATGIYFAKIEDVNGSSVTKKVIKN